MTNPQGVNAFPDDPAPSEPPEPLRILHRDDDLLVICKPPGLLVHRTALDAHEFDTVVERLRQQLGADAPPMLAPAHRLDKGTSGLLVLACHAEAARVLGQQFEQGLVHKQYLALVRGWLGTACRCDHPLARDPELPSTGQAQLPASTLFQPLARAHWPFQTDPRHPTSRFSLVQAEPLSGRRHQIRRHLKHLSHPIIGDATHGKGPVNRAAAAWLEESRLWLHAATLRMPHPRDGAVMHWHAPADGAWVRMLAKPGWEHESGRTATIHALLDGAPAG
ncbi:pseudouridine synthase [Ideonella sp.]|uniref:pseudouridine synthase n=1 Tax=Ideonella sp. TaxID=1929293 RepID=UPI003BB69C9A